MRVPADAAGERLDRFLARHLGSRAAAERAVEAGALVDGVARAKSYRLAGGEEVEVGEEPALPPMPLPPEPPIVLEDEHVLVVDKPAGLVVHPGAGHAGGTLVDALAGKIAGGDPERPGVVHRLDRDTSGLMALARSEEAHRRLAQLVRRAGLRADVSRARARTPALAQSGRIEAPIGRDRGDPTRISLDSDSPREAYHELRGRPALGRPRAAAGAARDRPHASDPRAPRRDRPAGGGRPDVRRPGTGSRAAVPPRRRARVPASVRRRRVETTSELPVDLAAFLAALD